MLKAITSSFTCTPHGPWALDSAKECILWSSTGQAAHKLSHNNAETSALLADAPSLLPLFSHTMIPTFASSPLMPSVPLPPALSVASLPRSASPSPSSSWEAWPPPSMSPWCCTPTRSQSSPLGSRCVCYYCAVQYILCDLRGCLYICVAVDQHVL